MTISWCRSARRGWCAKAATSRIVSYSITVGMALEAAVKLAAAEGIEAEVLDLRTLRPLDRGDGTGEPGQDQPD